MQKFPLQIVLELAERRAESKSRQVRLAHVAWLNTRTRLVRLQQWREHHVQVLATMMREGCQADVARQSAKALSGWQIELAAANAAERHAKQQWQQTLLLWQQENRRVDAFKALATRHAVAQRYVETRRENTLHDELAQRAWCAENLGGQDGFADMEQLA